MCGCATQAADPARPGDARPAGLNGQIAAGQHRRLRQAGPLAAGRYVFIDRAAVHFVRIGEALGMTGRIIPGCGFQFFAFYRVEVFTKAFAVNDLP